MIEKIGKDFDAVREDEQAASGKVVSSGERESQLMFPREMNGQYVNFKLTLRYSTKPRSHSSSAND